MVSDPQCMNFAAIYGSGGHLEFNVRTLGRVWFDQGLTDQVQALILHEFAHDIESNHLSHQFHDAICDLGAKFARLALTNPEFIAPFRVETPA